MLPTQNMTHGLFTPRRSPNEWVHFRVVSGERWGMVLGWVAWKKRDSDF